MVGLGDVPAVKRFVHHIHAELIAHIQRDLGGRIVGHPYGVEPVLLQDPDPAVLAVPVFVGADDSVIMVDASAPQQDALSVDQQSFPAVPPQSADPEPDTSLITLRYRLHGIETGILFAPQSGSGYRDLARDAFCQDVVAFHHAYRYRGILRCLRIYMDDRRIDGDSADLKAADIVLIFHHQGHIAEDPASAVPPAVGLQGIVHIHDDRIFLRMNGIGDVGVKTGISVAVTAHFFPVDRDNAVPVHTFEVQEQFLPGALLFCEGERFLISVLSSREIPAVDAVDRVRFPLLVDHRVIRKINLLPYAVFSGDRPVFVEIEFHYFHPVPLVLTLF